jgi:rhodanese-related sulfurtransferase
MTRLFDITNTSNGSKLAESDVQYKGDLSPEETFERMQEDPGAVMIDVRTQPEWAFVGVPAVERLLTLSWQVFPAMQVNPQFVADVEATGIAKNTQIFCLCRSGVRSAHAAAALTAAGFEQAYNVAGGFEGDKDPHNHRGKVNGWKHAGLPWVQS